MKCVQIDYSGVNWTTLVDTANSNKEFRKYRISLKKTSIRFAVDGDNFKSSGYFAFKKKYKFGKVTGGPLSIEV